MSIMSARCDRMHRAGSPGMEVPAISVDTQTVGPVHLVRHEAFAEKPDEVTGALSTRKHVITRIFYFVTHLSFPL